MTASHPLIMRALYIDADAYRQVIVTTLLDHTSLAPNRSTSRIMAVLPTSSQISLCSSFVSGMQDWTTPAS